MADPVIVQRGTTPERIVRVPLKNDEPDEAITGWAFRYNVVRSLATYLNQLPLFSIIPTIEDATERLVKITFDLTHTERLVGDYPGVLIWREDGTDPVSTVTPDDFEAIGFRVVEKVVATP